MDTSTFIVKRRNVRDHMEAQRVFLAEAANEKTTSPWHTLFSLGMKWGIFPMVQEWAVTSVGRWVVDAFRGRRKI